MWIGVALAFVVVIPIASIQFTSWYSQRCVEHAREIVATKLAHFEAIANTYTIDGTPEALQDMIEQLEQMMEEVQYIHDNNPLEKRD
eukprot:COSAG03_NODE_119_length_12315_cov_126.503847_2_plen_87_part_00